MKRSELRELYRVLRFAGLLHNESYATFEEGVGKYNVESCADEPLYPPERDLCLNELVHHHVFGYGPPELFVNTPQYDSNELAAGQVVIHMAAQELPVCIQRKESMNAEFMRGDAIVWCCEFGKFSAEDVSLYRAICIAAYLAMKPVD
jgi:hypothetical protein